MNDTPTPETDSNTPTAALEETCQWAELPAFDAMSKALAAVKAANV